MQTNRFDPRIALVVCMWTIVAGASSAPAADWITKFEIVSMDIYGHDPHVLTIQETDAATNVVHRTAVALDTESFEGYRGEFQYRRELWGLGLDFSWNQTGQLGSQRAAATGPGSEIVFQFPDASFTSTGPGEVLYYDRLEDTDLAAWTFDLYAVRQLAGTSRTGMEFRIGLRIADFDNDYRAVAGIENVSGLRIDTSSNYGAMRGPLVGVTGRFETGRNSFEGSIGQSIVLGEVELTNQRRAFTGPFSEEPAFFSDERFSLIQDVAIPMTDLRIEWQYRLSRMLSLGLSANGSAWWDVSVPPGVIPVEGGSTMLHENTLVFYGFGGFVELRF